LRRTGRISAAACRTVLYDNFNHSTRAAHLVFLPFFPLTPDQLAAQNISLSSTEQIEELRFVDWGRERECLFVEQATKVLLLMPSMC
jgi:hypothetical protein